MDFDSGFRIFVLYCYILITWILCMMDERALCRIIDIFCYCLCLLDFFLKLVGLRLSIFSLPPMNIEDNVQFRFGGTFAQHHCAWFFKLCAKCFQNSCDIAILEHVLLVKIVLYMM